MAFFHTLLIWIDRWYWLLLVAAAPFLLFPSPERAWVMLVVPVGGLLAWLATGRPLRPTPLNGALLVFTIMVGVSLYATYSVEVSLPKFAGLVLGLGAFFAIVKQNPPLYPPAGGGTLACSPAQGATEGDDPLSIHGAGAGAPLSPNIRGGRKGGDSLPQHGGRPRVGKSQIFCLALFLIVGLGIAAVGLLGTRWGAKIPALAPVTAYLEPRILGLPGAKAGINANEVGGALAWVVPVFVALSAWLVTSVGLVWRRVGWAAGLALPLLTWLGTAFVVAVLVLSQSRSAYIGVAAAVAGMIFFSLPRLGRLVFLILLVSLFIAALLVVNHIGFDAVWDEVFSASAAASPLAKLNGRVEVWARALEGINDFKFTGMGLNTFRGLVYVLYPLNFKSRVDIAHAHNEFLQAGLDLGIPGLVAFIALYIGAFAMLWEIWRDVAQRPRGAPSKDNAPLARAMTLGLGGGLFAHLVYGLTDAVALGAKPGILFWMLLGLVCGLRASRDPQEAR